VDRFGLFAAVALLAATADLFDPSAIEKSDRLRRVELGRSIERYREKIDNRVAFFTLQMEAGVGIEPDRLS